MNPQATPKTAFVLAGGGSLGAVQVGMLKALARRGVSPDFVVGASVGALNGACYAADPGDAGIARLERIWLRLRRAKGAGRRLTRRPPSHHEESYHPSR